MNYSDTLRSGTLELTSAGIPEAALDARLLLEFITGCTYADILAHPLTLLPDDKDEMYRALIRKRASHVPLAYITGSCEFMGITFTVNESVLIPRQDSECLVEEAMRYVYDGADILDLCTGSGCLLLSLMHYKNDCRGTGVDISEDALNVAKKNAAALDALGGLNHGSVGFFCGDLYDAVADRKYDFIISNPPYIKSSVIPDLMPEVSGHEPLIALDGGPDGLSFYRRIAAGAAGHLATGGMIFLETGYDEAGDVSRILADAGFTDIETVKDYGGNDRVVKAKI